MKWLLRAVVALLVVAGLSGCNTVRGIGQDLEQGGREIQEAVKK